MVFFFINSFRLIHKSASIIFEWKHMVLICTNAKKGHFFQQNVDNIKADFFK